MQYRDAAWLGFIYHLPRGQPPMLIYFPTTPPSIEINYHKIPQPIQKNIDCRLAPHTFFAGIAMIGQIHAFFQTFLIVDTPWTTQLNYMKYMQLVQLN